MAINSRIRVRQATQADLDTIVNIHFAAFDEGVMNRLMFPGGASQDSKSKFGSKLLPESGTEDGAQSAAKKGEVFLLVAEYLPEDNTAEGSGEVVAFARWLLHREPRSEEEWKGEVFTATSEGWGEGCDLAIVDAFIGEMNRKQQAHAKGEAALYLGILACSPARQRTGAGSALVEWGVRLADRLGLPCRLEASPVGYGLYRKFGFEDVDVLDLKVTETWGVIRDDKEYWGANNAVGLVGPAPDGVMRSVIMRRPQRKTNNV